MDIEEDVTGDLINPEGAEDVDASAAQEDALNFEDERNSSETPHETQQVIEQDVLNGIPDTRVDRSDPNEIKVWGETQTVGVGTPMATVKKTTNPTGQTVISYKINHVGLLDQQFVNNISKTAPEFNVTNCNNKAAALTLIAKFNPHANRLHFDFGPTSKLLPFQAELEAAIRDNTIPPLRP